MVDTQYEETCDDGNSVQETCDYGLTSCEVCYPCQLIAGATSYCSDLIVDVANGEACDDGNLNDCDGCSGDCSRFESCGNGFVECNEACDEGEANEPYPAFGGCDEECNEGLPAHCGPGPIDFHPNVAAVIRGALSMGGNDDIFYDDVGEMTALTIEGIAVDDLRGIDCIVNLRTLRAGQNNLGSNPDSLAALANLKRLQTVQLNDNGISYLGHLANLTTVQNLRLGDNDIVALNALSGMSALRDLSLENNQIVDVSPLSGLSELRTLNLRNNQIVSVEGLRTLTALESLTLWINQIQNIAPLAPLVNLTYLDLDTNQITNPEPLVEMTELSTLWLNNNQVANPIENGGLGNGVMFI